MGKRRSKVAKQKQAKQAKRSFGGVSMTKSSGGRSKAGKTKTTAAMLLDQQPPNKKQASMPFKGKPHLKRKLLHVRKPFGKSPNGRNKNDDFDREMHSLQERVAQHEYFQKALQQRNSKAHKLTEATIVVDDKKKSTQRLVNEAIEKISNFGGFGTAFSTKTPHPSPRSPHILQVMAAEQRAAWNREATERDGVEVEQESTNPWSVLQDDSDDEDSNHQALTKPAFAAPAFGSISLAAPTFSVDDPTIDPDL
uniref:Uncharacterized protein n=1 Tax=Grammatophora oceanica TaxID=210454 RepID=A0A7S1V0L1_9STRA|mmetsp:Transcript_32258/g.47924  ORF Transcript_32258/g.47924 Transcript_32258/m.47924 type:complete len:252 (+) Transcript_32258:151-906(+)|eukprot:CAMPEP_0194049106 /NCGR_PEP_ID=MMETSP0009_2-20130614/29679_1 /TAXON_ID=210454 /ORGANISM="Grammatophora oceanica, Strain CCMP 410" /LENGTH=251 /DNA_ID=CAMNT_0038695177 /DNA_START=142 /DNA_END=897 /DNA_ORIENTATION=+